MTEFLASVSPDIPWHVTAFHKDYKMDDPDDTRPADLLRAAEIGKQAGLRYIYAGNLPGMVGDLENTSCHNCGDTLIKRRSYFVEEYRLTAEWPVSILQHGDSGPLGAQIRRPDYRSSFLAAPELTFSYNPQLGSKLIFMRKLRIALALGFLFFAAACSPRDFLTRRLASDLIASSDTFKSTQQFGFRTGVISNKDYISPEYLVLQRRGWITGAVSLAHPTLLLLHVGRLRSLQWELRPFTI